MAQHAFNLAKGSRMPVSLSIHCTRTLLVAMLISLSFATTVTVAQEPGQVKSYYSPVVRVEADKGFLLITTDSGILWVQVEDAVKPHLKTIGVGDMIDVVVQFRPDNLPPLLQSWKLARSESPCKVFDGKTCGK